MSRAYFVLAYKVSISYFLLANVRSQTQIGLARNVLIGAHSVTDALVLCIAWVRLRGFHFSDSCFRFNLRTSISSIEIFFWFL